MNVLSLFDGMACARIALDRAGFDVSHYYASELDKYAIKVAQENYPSVTHIGDVCDVQPDNYPNIDLLIGGSPCQGFSIASGSKRLDFDDPRSKLLFEYVRILNVCKPKYFLLENVASMSQEVKHAIDELVGVSGAVINSDLFVQQNRERVYWTNIPIAPLPKRPDWVGDFYQWRRNHFRQNKSNVCPCLTANMGTGGHNVPLKSEDLKDKLTPLECERLQTVPDNYTASVSNTQRYKMLGNGFTVDVIAHILKGMRDV